jgi:L-fucose mutarotase/ribose pyranase (RbsD/FucU family)
MNLLDEFSKRIVVLGHRNWVIVADAAYPEQCAPGIELVAIDGSHLAVVSSVAKALDIAPHIRAVACLDAELNFLRDQDIPEVEDLRRDMRSALAPMEIEEAPHEEILANISEAASLYKVLVIKTSCLIPYTSVFFRLECGYWDEDHERTLKARMETWWQQ